MPTKTMSRDKGFCWELPTKEQPKEVLVNFTRKETMLLIAGLEVLKKRFQDDLRVVQSFVSDKDEKERLEIKLASGLNDIEQMKNKIISNIKENEKVHPKS